MKMLEGEHARISRAIEKEWKQKSHLHWLREGDKNTKFFHVKASAKKKKNQIRKLVIDNHEESSDPQVISNHFVKHFSSIFTSDKFPVVELLNLPVFPSISASHFATLELPYSRDEIAKSFKAMKPYSAPAPDGLTPKFFKTYWSVVRPLATDTVLGILEGKPLDLNINHTFISLIPKNKMPLTVNEFRPISLCNVLYKVVSKVIANRIKPILEDLVSPSQSAFIPGRNISDNSVLCARP